VIVHFISFYPLLGHFNFADLGLYYFAATPALDFIQTSFFSRYNVFGHSCAFYCLGINDTSPVTPSLSTIHAPKPFKVEKQ